MGIPIIQLFLWKQSPCPQFVAIKVILATNLQYANMNIPRKFGSNIFMFYKVKITSTVSLRLFRYWTVTVACGSDTCVQNLSKIGQELTIFENWPWPEEFRPPALGKVIDPRSNMTCVCDIVSRIRNILVPVWRVYDDRFKSYDQ